MSKEHEHSFGHILGGILLTIVSFVLVWAALYILLIVPICIAAFIWGWIDSKRDKEREPGFYVEAVSWILVVLVVATVLGGVVYCEVENNKRIARDKILYKY